MAEVVVRDARREDMLDVMEMIKELAVFEGYPNGPKITHEDLIKDAFDSPNPKVISMVAEDKSTGKLAGHVLGNYAYSSWTGLAMYIEDIYVREAYRKQKVGHKLLKAYCKLAKEKGCSRIDWHVLMNNEQAIKFYKDHGAWCLEDVEKRFCMRLLKEKIHLVADG